MAEPPPLEPDSATRAAWMAAMTEFAERHLAGLGQRSAAGLPPEAAAAVLQSVPRGVPTEPLAIESILARLATLAELGLQTNGPGYLAYVPGGGLFASAVASFVTLVMNRFTALALASPGLARFEHDIIQWLCREVGLPPSAGGFLSSGGSIANLSAVVAARVARFGESGDFSRATLYTSREAHRSVVKAARLAGIPGRNVTLVAVDAQMRLDVGALRSAIAADRARGLEPFMIVAAGGTTNTGAIDPLDVIADVAATERLWYHVDAAYGGCFVLTEEGRAALVGIARADSITLDPHKGFFLPYGCGCLLVRDAATLTAAFSDRGAYLQDLGVDAACASAADHGPELSRNERALLLWVPLALHGVDAFRAALVEKLALARRLRAGISHPEIEIPLEPELSIVAFRLRRPQNLSLSPWSAANAAWRERINARGRVHVSSTLLPVVDGEVLTIRACILSFRTDSARIDQAIEDIVATIRE